MPLLINLRHLEKKSLRLQGDLPAAELELEAIDELIRFPEPLRYDLEIQKIERSLLVQGRWHLELACECARCLKPFRHSLAFDDWACHLPLEGEEQAQIINDCVDLTPCLREDILLAFPQHPLCEMDCKGLPLPASAAVNPPSGGSQTKETSSAWAELNKLKF